MIHALWEEIKGNLFAQVVWDMMVFPVVIYHWKKHKQEMHKKFEEVKKCQPRNFDAW